MIVGLLPSAHAQTLISNLIEAEVDPATISMVSQPPSLAQKFINLSGSYQAQNPQNLANQLTKLAMPSPSLSQFIGSVSEDKVAVVVELPVQAWLTEMFTDHQAQSIWSSPHV